MCLDWGFHDVGGDAEVDSEDGTSGIIDVDDADYIDDADHIDDVDTVDTVDSVDTVALVHNTDDVFGIACVR